MKSSETNSFGKLLQTATPAQGKNRKASTGKVVLLINSNMVPARTIKTNNTTVAETLLQIAMLRRLARATVAVRQA